MFPLFLSYLCIRSFRKLGAFAVGVFFDSSYPSCERFSRSQTTIPHPTLHRALEFRWGLPYLLPTLLSILQEASRVQRVRREQSDLGGVFAAVPLPLSAAPQLCV